MNFKDLNKLLINLPERADRLKQFKAQTYLPLSNLQTVSGIRNHSQPMLGIAQAHLNCISIAKGNEWDKVLIMEDDCIFQGGVETFDYVLSCLENIPKDWNVLLGGIYEGVIVPENQYWNKIKGQFCGLHFYIVNSNCYDSILAYDGTQHIDRWINLKGGLNCYVAAKFFATQSDGFSDNTGKNEDYKNKLDKYKLL